MIYDLFQQGIVNALAADTWFSATPSILVIPEESALPDTSDMSDEDAQDAIVSALEDRRKLVQNALNTSGVALVVSEVESESGQSPNMFTVRCTIGLFENRKKTAASKPNRSGRNTCARAQSILQRYVVPILYNDERIDPFQKILTKSNKFVGDEDGTSIREMVIESMIAIEAVDDSLVSESNYKLETL